MTARDCSAYLGAFALVALYLTLAGPAHADRCELKMGPYESQSAAELGVQQARGIGHDTSGVWGEGGIVSHLSTRRYFFNVLFRC
jgi:hypothetical protein